MKQAEETTCGIRVYLKDSVSNFYSHLWQYLRTYERDYLYTCKHNAMKFSTSVTRISHKEMRNARFYYLGNNRLPEIASK